MKNASIIPAKTCYDHIGGKRDVEEQIHIRFYPIKSIMEKVFSKQHAELFKNIEQLR